MPSDPTREQLRKGLRVRRAELPRQYGVRPIDKVAMTHVVRATFLSFSRHTQQLIAGNDGVNQFRTALPREQFAQPPHINLASIQFTVTQFFN